MWVDVFTKAQRTLSLKQNIPKEIITMKKTTAITLAILLIAIMTLAFVSCDNTGDGATEVPTSAPTEAPTQRPNEAPTEAPTGDNQQGTIDETAKHTHSYTEQIVSDEHFKSAANCLSRTAYFYSCKCGENGTETFVIGDINAENHVGGTIVDYNYTNDTIHEVVEHCKGCFGIMNVTEQSHESSCTLCTKHAAPGLYETGTENIIYTWDELIHLGIVNLNGSTITASDASRLAGSLVISNDITAIGYSAFYGCYNLSNVVLPKNLTILGGRAFYG